MLIDIITDIFHNRAY